MSSFIAGRQESSTITPHQKFEGHTDWVTGVILATDATSRSVRPVIVACSRAPRDFVNDTLHLSAQHRPNPRSSLLHRSTLRNHFLSLFRPTHPRVVEVPCQLRISSAEIFMPISRPTRKNSTASSSYHSNSTVTMHSSDEKLQATGCDDHNAYMWDISAIDDLLSDKRDKSLLAIDATPRPVRQPTMGFPRVLRDFINDTLHLPAQHRPHPRSSPSHRSTFRNRFLTLFRPTHPRVVEATCQHRHRNASARRQGPFPRLTVAQQSSGAAQTQPSSQPHAAVRTSTAPPVATNTRSNTNPHATIKHAGRWARFRHFI